MSLTGESITIEHELKVSRKLERFVEENDLELFFDTEEVSHAIDVCRMILQEYEEVHVELIHELGTENYEQRFKIDYEKLRETMMSWIKSAKIDVHWGEVKMLKKCTFSVIFANMNCSIQGTFNRYNSAKS